VFSWKEELYVLVMASRSPIEFSDIPEENSASLFRVEEKIQLSAIRNLTFHSKVHIILLLSVHSESILDMAI
jgi:hypothetical protein